MNGPALKGQQFMDNWREDSVKSLFTLIQTSMPRRAPASLSGLRRDVVPGSIEKA